MGEEDETNGWNQGHQQGLGGPLEGVRISEHAAFINGVINAVKLTRGALEGVSSES